MLFSVTILCLAVSTSNASGAHKKAKGSRSPANYEVESSGPMIRPAVETKEIKINIYPILSNEELRRLGLLPE